MHAQSWLHRRVTKLLTRRLDPLLTFDGHSHELHWFQHRNYSMTSGILLRVKYICSAMYWCVFHSHFLLVIPSPTDPNPIFPVNTQTNPSSHLPFRPLFLVFLHGTDCCPMLVNFWFTRIFWYSGLTSPLYMWLNNIIWAKLNLRELLASWYHFSL